METRIATVEINGIKATDRELTLGPLTAVLGAVGSGKSTVLDALRFAALGHVPALGKSEAATARLLRNGRLEVVVTLDDGRSFSRRLIREGGRLRGEAWASWLPPKTSATEAGEEIRALFGRSAVEATEALDLRDLLAASPAERSKRIEQLLDASGIEPALLAMRGAALTRLRLAEIPPHRIPAGAVEADALAQGTGAMIAPELRAAAGEVSTELGKLLLSAGLGSAQEQAKARKLEAGAQTRQRVAARAELENRLVALGDVGETLEQLQAQRDALAATLARSERDLEEFEKWAAVRASAEQALPALRAEVAQAEAELAAAVEALPRAGQARAEAEAIVDPADVVAPELVTADPGELARAEEADTRARGCEADARAIQIPEVTGGDAGHALLARADELLAQSRAIVIPEPLSVAGEEAELAAAVAEAKRAESSPWREVEGLAGEIEAWAEGQDRGGAGTRAAIDRLRYLAEEHGGDAVNAAVHVTQAEEALARAREFQAVRAAEIAARAMLVAELETEATKLEGEAKAARTAALATSHAAANAAIQRQVGLLAEAQGFRQTASRIRHAAEAESARVNGEARSRYAEAFSARATAVSLNRSRRENLELEARTIEGRAATAQGNLDRARADLAAVEARLAGISSVEVDVAAATAQHESSMAGLADIAERLARAEAVQARRSEMASLVEAIDRATAEAKAWGAAEWATQRLREEDVAARASGLEGRMRIFLRAAGRTEEPYLRAGRGVCEFGWRRGEQEISVETLSGGEACVFLAGLAAAVIGLRGPEVRLLLVEAAEAGSGDVAMALLRGCEAVADQVQVVLATNAPIEPPEGWTVYRLGSGAGAAAVVTRQEEAAHV